MNTIRFLFFLCLLLLFSNCQNEESSINKNSLASLKAYGISIHDAYGFCGIVYEEIPYSYRSGVWKYIANESIKIAEGPYYNTLIHVTDYGGCPYSYYTDSAAISKWSFWDLKGNPIPSNQRFKNIIQSKDTIWPLINLSN
ncbi:hypothetical protein ACFO3O_11285 [Dokdonia ponticola]|uniref:Uncharacterized protein n=1 Tax=Dokdonia ponticola TaxID=2041041 RepID=A0ABV9HWY2_9FLAO